MLSLYLSLLIFRSTINHHNNNCRFEIKIETYLRFGRKQTKSNLYFSLTLFTFFVRKKSNKLWAEIINLSGLSIFLLEYSFHIVLNFLYTILTKKSSLLFYKRSLIDLRKTNKNVSIRISSILSSFFTFGQVSYMR